MAYSNVMRNCCEKKNILLKNVKWLIYKCNCNIWNKKDHSVNMCNSILNKTNKRHNKSAFKGRYHILITH